MSILVREPSQQVRALIARFISESSNMQPQEVIDAAVNHLGATLMIKAKIESKSRGEAKAYARKVCNDIVEMMLANFDQGQK